MVCLCVHKHHTWKCWRLVLCLALAMSWEPYLLFQFTNNLYAPSSKNGSGMAGVLLPGIGDVNSLILINQCPVQQISQLGLRVLHCDASLLLLILLPYILYIRSSQPPSSDTQCTTTSQKQKCTQNIIFWCISPHSNSRHRKCSSQHFPNAASSTLSSRAKRKPLLPSSSWSSTSNTTMTWTRCFAKRTYAKSIE